MQVYDEADSELLILGEPGAGKTTLLLELASVLLDRAEADERQHIPVVLNLSSWAQKRLPLSGWLVEELWTKYQIPRRIGQAWIDTDQVLTLLDGLDEVAESTRFTCVQAINVYQQNRLEKGPLPLVICCRSKEYMALSTRVNLHRAVSVQPLTSEQIERYLQSAGNQLDMLQHALHYDPELQEMAHQPLMLSIFTLAYQGAGPEELSTDGTREAQQRQVFATYVERMLTHRGVSKSTSREQTVRWLTFLAKRMQQYNQTVFYLEHLQPDWLTDRGRRLLYRLSVGLSIGLVFGVSAGLSVGLRFGLILVQLGVTTETGLTTGLQVGLLTTLLATLIYGLGQIQPKEVLTLSWRWIKGNIVVGLLVALSIGLVLGGSFGDEATERLLLYKVGGGYIFTHRLLLDYFASLTPVAPTSAEKDGHRA